MEQPVTTKSLRERLLSGSAWAFSARVLAVIVSIGVNAMLARLLDPAELGAYFLAVSLVAFLAIFSQLGLADTIVRLVAESIATGRTARVSWIMRLALRLGCVSGLIVAAIVAAGLGGWLAIAIFNSPLLAGISALLALWILARTLQGLFVAIFRGFHDIRLASIFGELLSGIFCALAFGILWATRGQADLTEVVAVSVAAAITATVIAAVLVRSRTEWSYDDRAVTAAGMLRASWPLWITNLVFFAVSQSDILIVGAMLSQADVALYGSASRLIKLMSLVLLIVNAVLPPLIAELYATGENRRLERMTRGVATLASIPAMVILALFMFGGEHILALLFGHYYGQAAAALIILSIGQLANVWAGSCGLVLMYTGFQKTMMTVTVFAGFVAVLGSIIMARSFGYLGVAIAFSTAMILQNLAMLLAVRNRTGMWTHVEFRLLLDPRGLVSEIRR